MSEQPTYMYSGLSLPEGPPPEGVLPSNGRVMLYARNGRVWARTADGVDTDLGGAASSSAATTLVETSIVLPGFAGQSNYRVAVDSNGQLFTIPTNQAAMMPAGPVGPAGPPGLQGPHGLKGEPGAAGITGPPGERGPAGTPGTGLTYRGAWGAGGGYAPDDLVTYDGETFRSRITITAGSDAALVPPPGSSVLWEVVSRKGEAGPQGPIGPAGPEGAPGLQGPRGLQGEAGAAGSAGPPGSTGERGLQGEPGPQGLPGAQGLQGEAGRVGPSGPQGAQGNVGPAGPAGLTFRGLWLPGAQYEVGDAVTYSGSSYFATDPPPAAGTPPLPGDASNDADTNTGWALLAMEGAPGPQGPQGIQGTRGERGLPGETGTQGPTGPAGLQGQKGDTGDIGPAGTPGAEGPQGLQGPQGLLGPTGPQGPVGNKGETGSQGPAGIQGLKGDTGSQGATGPAGSTGPVGPAGPQGLTGLKGDPGIPGPQGDIGPPGLTHRGAWSSVTTYFVNDAVSHNGAYWRATTNHSNQTPSTSNTNWAIVAERGATGATGATGSTGATGATGSAGATGPAGPGLDPGGTAKQLIVKNSGTDYDTVWRTGVPAYSGSVRLTSNVSVPNNIDQHITTGWGAASIQNSAVTWSASNGFTLNLAGRWLIGWNLRWAVGGVGGERVNFIQDATNSRRIAMQSGPPSVNGVSSPSSVNCVATYYTTSTLVVVRPFAYQNSGAALNIDATAFNDVEFWAVWLGSL